MICRWMLGAVNTHLNRLFSRSLASVVCSHLFAGGQGLEGENRNLDIPSRKNNCYSFCLIKLVKYPEILGYFFFPLPLTRIFPSIC